jgi:hypothetical protein
MMEGTEIKCPRCKEVYNHQEAPVVWMRKEDQLNSIVYDISETEPGQPCQPKIRDSRWNPSPRRHGLTVTMYCEICGENWLLELYQHKGVTYLRGRP